MSVVIIGGHDRMVCQYKQICKSFNCKAKVFTQMAATLSKRIGKPDLIVLFLLKRLQDRNTENLSLSLNFRNTKFQA